MQFVIGLCLGVGIGFFIGGFVLAAVQIARRSDDRDYETDAADEKYADRYGSDEKLKRRGF